MPQEGRVWKHIILCVWGASVFKVPTLGPFLPTQFLSHLYPSSQVIVCWGVCTSTSGSLLGPLSHRPEVSLEKVVGTGKSCGAR